MSEDGPPDEESAHRGPSLAADGTLEGRLSRLEPGPPATVFSPPTAERLELADVAPAVPSLLPQVVAPPKVARARRRWPQWLIGGVLLFAAGLVGATLVAGRDTPVALPLPLPLPVPLPTKLSPKPTEDGVRPIGDIEGIIAPTHSRLVIDSEPPGASIVVKGAVIGTTPWAGDNTFGEGARIDVRLPGYRAWSGVAPKGPDQVLSVKLRK